jgi:uncharacterized protein HemX
MTFGKDLDGMPQTDEALEQTLKDFRASVHAWSEAELGMPRKPVPVYRTSWRVAAGWALGCVLAVGSVGGGLYERHHVKEQAKAAAAAAAQQQKIEAEQRKQNEELFAKVDSDVSREVPSAMEPLAQMMDLDSMQ